MVQTFTDVLGFAQTGLKFQEELAMLENVSG